MGPNEAIKYSESPLLLGVLEGGGTPQKVAPKKAWQGYPPL